LDVTKKSRVAEFIECRPSRFLHGRARYSLAGIGVPLGEIFPRHARLGVPRRYCGTNSAGGLQANPAMQRGAHNMKTKVTNVAAGSLARFATILILLFAMPLAIGLARAAAADDSPSGADDAALKQVVAGFSNGWNAHDAHAMCLSLADDVQWVNWRGEPLGTRQAVEDEHAKLFADLYKNTHRTDTVKSIRYLGPDLAVLDDYWTMTGARKRDGSDWPYRAGYANWLLAKRNGRWIVIVSHTADFNAIAPAAK
jgi:uncharacterized protein (TIGR02246 family)